MDRFDLLIGTAMAKPRTRTGSRTPVAVQIDRLDQEGRGVARIDNKVVFVHGALPGEQVVVQCYEWHKHYDVAMTQEVQVASPLRVTPRCAHYYRCGGCSLQHLKEAEQIRFKQQTLLDMLSRIGKVSPTDVLAPLDGQHWGYRRRARLGVRYVRKKGKVLVGFRERESNYLTEIERCEVLHPSVGERIGELAALVQGMDARDRIAQIEVAVGDALTALVFRNLDPLGEDDRVRLCQFAQQTGFAVYLQPSNAASLEPLCLPTGAILDYQLPEFDVQLGFLPTDFVQVNATLNQAMISRALALLDLQSGDRVLDLFCGLGNFTMPLARRAATVVAVEGEAGLVQRARENSQANGITNVEYHVADLAAAVDGLPWMQGGYDKVLLDPPRSGAQALLPAIAKLKASRIVYVSCGPATLARDAGILVHELGYRLTSAGVMDMFPQTGHVESIALFELA